MDFPVLLHVLVPVPEGGRAPVRSVGPGEGPRERSWGPLHSPWGAVVAAGAPQALAQRGPGTAGPARSWDTSGVRGRRGVRKWAMRGRTGPLGGGGRGQGGAPGPHRNTARQAMDGLWTEVCGQQKQSNDPGNNQHILNTPTTGLRERGNDTSKSTGRSGRQKIATRRNMRREERVTVQGPVKEQQPDGMSHRGGGVGGRGGPFVGTS